MARTKEEIERDKKNKPTSGGVQGTKFQTGNKKVTSGADLIQDTRKREMAADLKRTQLIQDPGMEQRNAEAEAKQVAEQTGFTRDVNKLTEELNLLTSKEGQPSLKPPSIFEQKKQEQQRKFMEGTAGQKAKDILFGTPQVGGQDVQLGVAPAIGIGGGGLGGLFKIKSMVQGAVSKSSAVVNLAAAGLIFNYAVGDKPTDIGGKNIQSLKNEISNFPGQSSTILSGVKSGAMSPEEGLMQLRQLADTVSEAERAIQTAGIYSLEYRRDKEYLKIQQQIKDVRLNIIERVGGINQLALTGTSNLSPEEIRFSFGGLEQ